MLSSPLIKSKSEVKNFLRLDRTCYYGNYQQCLPHHFIYDILLLGPVAASAKFIEQATPQQENNYDCGVYVMAIAQVLCNAFCERKRGRSTDYAGLVRTTVTPSNVSKMRYTTMELIHSLSANEEDRCVFGNTQVMLITDF